MTVTAAESGTTFNGVLLRVKVLTGTSLSQAGAATASFQGTGAQQASITTTVTGSQVYGALKNSGSTATFTANGSTTLFDNVSDASNGEAFGTCRSTSATGSPGAVTIGASAPSVAGQTALVEVLPSGTITEDASGPAQVNTLAGITITTASFTPPAGSLLVAMVLADANASTVVTVSGGGLTWTEVKKSQSTSPTGYAGVWIAQIAPASSPVQTRPVEPGQTWLRHFKHRAILPPVPLIPPPPPPTVQPFVGDFIPGVAVPGVAIPANPGTPPAQPIITRAARPGAAWLRHFRRQTQPTPPQYPPAVGVSGDASLSITDTVTATGVVGTSSGASSSTTVGITATGVVGTSSGAALTVTVGVVASASGGANLAITDTITATGVVGTVTGADRPITVGLTAAGVVATSSGVASSTTVGVTASGIVGASSGASSSTTVGVTAVGVVGVSSGASLVVTVGAVAAGGSVIANRPTTVTVTAAGFVATSTGANSTTTVTVTASGVVGTASGAALAVTAAVVTAGQVGKLSGAAVATTVTVAAAGLAINPFTLVRASTAVISGGPPLATVTGAPITAAMTGGPGRSEISYE